MAGPPVIRLFDEGRPPPSPPKTIECAWCGEDRKAEYAPPGSLSSLYDPREPLPPWHTVSVGYVREIAADFRDDPKIGAGPGTGPGPGRGKTGVGAGFAGKSEALTLYLCSIACAKEFHEEWRRLRDAIEGPPDGT